MNNLNLFILLWGPSGSGKDYFAKNVHMDSNNKNSQCNISFYMPTQYTDRPMRATESQGDPYIFCTNYPEDNGADLPYWDDEIKELQLKGRLLSITRFDTTRGLFRYALAYNQEDIGKNLIMATSYFQILDIFKWKFENRNKDFVKNTVLWPIFIDTDASTRLIKLYNREMDKNEIDRNFQEIVRRFVESDSIDYSSEAEKTVNCLFSKELKEMNINVDHLDRYTSILNDYSDLSYLALMKIINNIPYILTSDTSETD